MERVIVEESVVKRVDPQGRVLIPMDWRRDWKSDRVVLRRLGDRIEVTPIAPVSPSSLFDSIEVGDEVDFTDPHSLKRALVEQGEP